MAMPEKYGYRLREIRKGDEMNLVRLLEATGYHSSNLPNDPLLAGLKVARSIECFRSPEDAESPLWMFALERMKDGAIVGFSLITDVSHRLCYNVKPAAEKYAGMLQLRPEDPGTLELGGLLLAKQERGKGLLALLSASRIIFLEMMAARVERLISEFLLWAPGKEDGANPYFWRTVTSRLPILNGYLYRMVEYFWKDTGIQRHLRQILPECIEFDPAYGDITASPSIHPDSVPARRLLTKLGLVNGLKIEADGSIWHEAPWRKTRNILHRARLGRRYPGTVVCPPETNPKTAIAAWRSPNGFFAQYVPLETGEDGESVTIGTCGSPVPASAELFAF